MIASQISSHKARHKTKEHKLIQPRTFLRSATSRIIRRLIASRAFGPAELIAACRKFGIQEVVANGTYGKIHGRVDDKYIMASYLTRKAWDPDKIAYINQELSNGGTFIDVGANIGMYTIPIATNTSVQCIAIEPEPENFRMLKNNVEINCKGAQITLHNLAITEHESRVLMSLSRDNFGDHRVQLKDATTHSGRGIIEVSSRRLDEVITSDFRPPVVMKVDVQGLEPAVMKSAGTLVQTIDLLLIEVWPYGMKVAGQCQDEFLDGLVSTFPQAACLQKGDRLMPDIPFSPTKDVVRSILLSSQDDAKISYDLVLRRHRNVNY